MMTELLSYDSPQNELKMYSPSGYPRVSFTGRSVMDYGMIFWPVLRHTSMMDLFLTNTGFHCTRC